MNSDTRHRTFGIVLIVALVLVAISWIFLSWPKALSITIAMLAFVLVSVPVFRPVRGRLALCFVTFSLFAAACGWMAFENASLVWFVDWVNSLLGKTSSELIGPPPHTISQYVVLAATLAAYLFSLWRARDDTAMGVHPQPAKEDRRDPEYRDRVENFCGRLKVNLDQLDEEANWSEALFVPLEAEVEVRTGRRRQRRIAPLISALTGNRHHRFLLLLGDPGSGKSVALRKLARDLLAEVPKTGRVPVYLNLRDWETPPKWSAVAPLDVAEIEIDLRQWVLRNLQDRLDIYGRQFLDAYFDTMMKGGDFFFILDSFDEVALLLGVDERHPLVEAIGNFLGGMHHSRGILASRFFRKPTARFNASCQLEIRPLSGRRFAQLAHKRFLEAGLTDRLLSERPDLAAAARNPFFAALLVQYVTDSARPAGPPELPASRGEIFAAYLQRRLAASQEYLKQPKLHEDKLLAGLETLADAMFQQHTSFELPLSKVTQLVPPLENAMLFPALEKARVVRMGQGVDPHVSFTHRRFAEYLAARNLLRKPEGLPLEDIPSDSLWRDTLVLYCEIAPEDQARAVAEYCWSQMTALRERVAAEDSAAWLRSLHCLRFLAEAFRTHPEAIGSFREQLYSRVLETTKEGDVLSAKWALETAGLYGHEQSTQLIHAALKRDNPWLAETALGACRYLRQLDPALHWALLRAITAKPYVELWTQRRDLDVAFSGSAALRPVLFFFWTTVLDSWVWAVALVLVLVMLSAALAMAQVDWSSMRQYLVLWLLYAFLFAYASGVGPRRMTFLIPKESFGLVVLYRIFVLTVPLLSVLFIWLDRYFPDPLAGLIERDLTRHSRPIDQVLMWTMSPFVFVPWLVFFIYQYSAKLNALVRGRRLKILALTGLGAGAAVLVSGAFLGLMWSVFYCFRRALDAPGLSRRSLVDMAGGLGSDVYQPICLPGGEIADSRAQRLQAPAGNKGSARHCESLLDRGSLEKLGTRAEPPTVRRKIG